MEDVFGGDAEHGTGTVALPISVFVLDENIIIVRAFSHDGLKIQR